MRARLQDDVIREALTKLGGWEMRGNALYQKFEFADFRAAFAFMTRVAEVAEKMNHHPDWRNVYKTVEMTLSTHDAGGITKLDLRLAEEINQLK